MVEETKVIQEPSSTLSENASESVIGDYLNNVQSEIIQEGFEPRLETTVKAVENKPIQGSIQIGVII